MMMMMMVQSCQSVNNACPSQPAPSRPATVLKTETTNFPIPPSSVLDSLIFFFLPSSSSSSSYTLLYSVHRERHTQQQINSFLLTSSQSLFSVCARTGVGGGRRALYNCPFMEGGGGGGIIFSVHEDFFGN